MSTIQRNMIATLSLCTGVLMVTSGAVQASLIDRGGGLIYDTDLDITWLANANYAAGSSYDNGVSATDGRMTWQNAMDWAANLTYYDTVRNVIYDDWRLPTSNACTNYNCTGSEMGHLFYNELGGVQNQSITTTHDADYNLFTNIYTSSKYWSGTEYTAITTNAWFFDYNNGNQGYYYNKGSNFYAWAVRPGDVASAASTVPVPTAAWLFGSGLLWLVGVGRKNQHC